MVAHPLLSTMVCFVVFAGISGLGFAVYLKTSGNRRRAIARLRNLGVPDAQTGPDKPSLAELARTTLPKIGALLMPRKEDRQAFYKKRLLQAGFYDVTALHAFLGTKLSLMLVLPLLSGVLLFLLANLTVQLVILVMVVSCSVGMFGPNLWLEQRVKQRQRVLRNGLPDALDMLVLCLEGGVSLVAALQRITGELHIVHPELGREMNILQREIELGLSAGQALKKMGERCGLEDVRDLASVLLQSERFGASMVQALRQHADAWRTERQHRAEEQAQKAAVKILFPTMLCIFPAIFIVLLGPAAVQIGRLFAR